MEGLMAIVTVLASAFYFGAPLLFGTTGEILTEKSGSLNLGVEGTMAIGAIGGFIAGASANNLFVGMLVAFLCSSLCGLIFSFLTVTLKANQNVTGLAMTIFGVGLCQLVGQTLKTKGKFPAMSAALTQSIANNGIPGLKNIPVIGELLFQYNIFVYVAIIIAIIAWIFMFKTKAGLRMRAVGENPASADSVGINVDRTRYVNNIIGSGIMGLGGLYMAMVINIGTWNDNWIGGYGWIAVALVIFASWSPARAIGGSFLFGLLIALQSRVSILANAFPTALGWLNKIPVEFYKMLPFVITALVIILNSIGKKKEGIQPTACGINYYREER